MKSGPLGKPRASLRGRGAPPVIAVQSIFLGGVILEVAAPAQVGMELGLDLSHPALGTLTTSVGVSWCRSLAGHASPVAALEFRGSWDALVILRGRLAAYLGNRVFDGPRFVGYLLQEPNDVASSCFDVQTAKIALLGPNGGIYSVRRRDAPPGSPLESAPTYIEAVKVAFSLSALPSLNVPGAAPAPPPPPRPGPPPSPSSSEEEIFGMNTVVLKPEKVISSEEEEILGARTVVVQDSEAKISGKDSAVLGGGGFGPKAEGSVHSKVFDGDDLLGYVAPSVAADSWNVYGKNGKKLALLASSDDGSIRVCVMGRKSDESLVFLEADDHPASLALAFKWDGGALRVDPPLAGF